MQALRFAAALAVVVLHSCFYVQEALGVPAPNLRVFGEAGVWLFFAISGFVMVLVTDRQPRPSPRRFLAARIARVVPLAWLMTSVAVALGALGLNLNHAESPAVLRIVASYLFLPTESPSGLIQPVWNVGWTLVFEIAFYLLVTFALTVRVDPLTFCTPVLLLAAGAAAFRPPGGSVWWFYADPAVLCFLLGMVTARFAVRRWTLRHIAVTTGLTAVVVATTAPEGTSAALLSGCTFATIAVILWLAIVHEDRIGPLLPRWLVRGGDTSYALYLTHPLVGTAFVAGLGIVGGSSLPMPVLVLTTVAVAVVCAPLVHRWVDRPLVATARRVLEVRRRAVTRVAAP
ncbi:acyltransferase [Curtobacterium flaccumfaciens]|nr:acyltransferase [Curtobacterium flaccumfaciens]